MIGKSSNHPSSSLIRAIRTRIPHATRELAFLAFLNQQSLLHSALVACTLPWSIVPYLWMSPLVRMPRQCPFCRAPPKRAIPTWSSSQPLHSEALWDMPSPAATFQSTSLSAAHRYSSTICTQSLPGASCARWAVFGASTVRLVCSLHRGR